MGNGLAGVGNTRQVLKRLEQIEGIIIRNVKGTDEVAVSHPNFNNGRVVRIKVAGRKDTPRVLATMLRRLER